MMIQQRRSTSTSNDTRVTRHDTDTNKRDDVRRTLMLVSHQQHGGRNFLRFQENDTVPYFVNLSGDTDDINMEELTVMDDETPYHKICSNSLQTNTCVEENDKSFHKRAGFLPEDQKYCAHATNTIPPSQRVDKGDNRIALLSPVPESKAFVSSRNPTLYTHHKSDGDDCKEFLVVNDHYEKLNDDGSNRNVRVPRRGVKPTRAEKQRVLSILRKDNVEKSDQIASMNKEIEVLPIKAKPRDTIETVCKIVAQECDLWDGIHQSAQEKMEDNNYDKKLQFQPPLPAKYGRKATSRSLISMSSKESNTDSLMSTSLDGVSPVVIRHTESIGFHSILSTGSTAHELDCIVANPVTVVSSPAAGPLGAVSKPTTSFATQCVDPTYPSIEIGCRPSNPMAMSLLQYSTSFATVDSSRMSIVSSTSIGSPPPSIIPVCVSRQPIQSAMVNHITGSFHEYNQHRYYSGENFNQYYRLERNCFNSQPVEVRAPTSQQVHQGIVYLLPESMTVDNNKVVYSKTFGIYNDSQLR
jgi:hypothetical protein